jgi:hypothetical protein
LDQPNGVGLKITKSNVTIRGYAPSGPTGTVISRGSASIKWLMYAADGVTGVNIQNLTFGGNRYPLGLDCSNLSAK